MLLVLLSAMAAVTLGGVAWYYMVLLPGRSQDLLLSVLQAEHELLEAQLAITDPEEFDRNRPRIRELAEKLKNLVEKSRHLPLDERNRFSLQHEDEFNQCREKLKTLLMRHIKNRTGFIYVGEKNSVGEKFSLSFLSVHEDGDTLKVVEF